MILDLGKLGSGDIHRVMTQVIVPRPIAWVLSDNGNGTWNFAPFSFFNGVCSDPPLLMLSIGLRSCGAKKDTWVNIEERADFVVHLADTEHGEEVSLTSTALDRGRSELELVNMATEAVRGERLPRVVGPKAAMFCTRHAIHEVGNRPQGLVLGEIRRVWLDDDVVRSAGDRIEIDAERLLPLSRLGGCQYAELGKISEIPGPG